MLLLCFLLLAMANWSLGGGLLRQFCGAAIFLSELCLFVTVACCELYLTVDGKALQADRRKEARQ